MTDNSLKDLQAHNPKLAKMWNLSHGTYNKTWHKAIELELSSPAIDSDHARIIEDLVELPNAMYLAPKALVKLTYTDLQKLYDDHEHEYRHFQSSGVLYDTLDDIDTKSAIDKYYKIANVGNQEDTIHGSICSFIITQLKRSASIELSKKNKNTLNMYDVVAADDIIWVGYTGERVTFFNFFDAIHTTSEKYRTTLSKYDFCVHVEMQNSKTVFANEIAKRENSYWGRGRYIFSAMEDMLISKGFYTFLNIWIEQSRQYRFIRRLLFPHFADIVQAVNQTYQQVLATKQCAFTHFDMRCDDRAGMKAHEHSFVDTHTHRYTAHHLHHDHISYDAAVANILMRCSYYRLTELDGALTPFTLQQSAQYTRH